MKIIPQDLCVQNHDLVSELPAIGLLSDVSSEEAFRDADPAAGVPVLSGLLSQASKRIWSPGGH